MPLVTVTLRAPKPRTFKDQVFGAVHAALVASGVPATDLFHRVLELGADDFRFDPAYPDADAVRDDHFVLIEILLSVGRSSKVKRKILEDLMASLKRDGFDPENVMVVFVETRWENWAFRGGRLIHA